MLKRTKGRLLISLLVVTGLAGTLNSSTLSQSERKHIVTELKQHRAAFQSEVDHLTDAQLHFRPPGGKPSIGEIIQSMAQAEMRISKDIEEIMDRPANPEQRKDILYSDEQLGNVSQEMICGLDNQKSGISFKHTGEAIKKFISARNANIKYLRTSTEDLRNHISESPLGWIDCYQRFLLLVERGNRCLWEIENVKLAPGYPAGKH